MLAMKVLILNLVFLLFIACASKDEKLSYKRAKWLHYDKNITKKPIVFKEEGDFEDMLNSSMSQLLEHGSAQDKTTSVVDYAAQNLKIQNINLLYEDAQSSLMFQKEIFINNDYVNYSGGLINRFALSDNVILGINGFLDKYQEQEISSYGGELGLSEYFKAYVNSYSIPKEELKNTQVGFSFVLPRYTALGLDVNADDEARNYTLNYAPYSLFNLAFTKKIYKDPLMPESNYIFFGFHLNYNQSFFKQLHPLKHYEKVDRYDFLRRKYD